MTKRGDVVILHFPFTDVQQRKARPALVVQNDRDNAHLRKTIVATITGNLKRAGEPTHWLIDPSTPDGALSGLHGPSLVSCVNLYTAEQASIIKTVGHLSPTSMQQIDSCLKAALELP